jgi:hypothetical protein
MYNFDLNQSLCIDETIRLIRIKEIATFKKSVTVSVMR